MTRCPFAHQLPGPPAKVYSSCPTHRKTGACLHEAEYDVTQDEQVLYNALFSDRQASWHFTITREGFLFQHYDLDATCWHCSWPGNLWLVGIELETTRNRKLTEPQYQVLVKLLKWLGQELGWEPWCIGHYENIGHYGYTHRSSVLWEHNEAQKPYTDCQVFSQGVVNQSLLVADLLIAGLEDGEEEMPEIDWPKEKLKLLRDYREEERAFWAWFRTFPESQAQKEDGPRQAKEDALYLAFYSARQLFVQAQIAWRSPPR